MTWKEEIKKEENDGVFLTNENFQKLKDLENAIKALEISVKFSYRKLGEMAKTERKSYVEARKLISELLKDANDKMR